MLAFSAGSAVLIVVAVVGLVVDPRTLDGVPIWTKPLKFALSGAVYGLTWAWLCGLIDRGEKAVRRATVVVVTLLSLELALIFTQALRGKHSHFNFETMFDAGIYEVMATSIVAVWCGALVLTVLVLKSDIKDRPKKLTVSLGAVLSIIGVGLGALMTLPTGAQLATLDAGHGVDVIGSHTVGAAGDLRVPHFVGMHALQALLVWHLAVAFLGRRWRFTSTTRSRLVIVGACGFAGLMALLTWQAYRGQSVSSPDGWTLGGLGALIAGTLAAALVVMCRTVRPLAKTHSLVPVRESSNRDAA
jgi:hypothetical protein